MATFTIWVKDPNPTQMYLTALLLRICREQPGEVPEEFRKFAGGDHSLNLSFQIKPNRTDGKTYVEFSLT